MSRWLLMFAALAVHVGASAASPITLTSHGKNAVSFWSEVAAQTVNASSPNDTTAEERRTVYAVDMATVQLAVHDAVAAIDGRFVPYAASPATAAPGASMPAAVSAATVRVLRGLFPSRADRYEPAYATYLADLADGDAKDRGIAIGNEVAAAILVRRASDGRSVELGPYEATTLPGRYRGRDPVLRFAPAIRPFALTAANQFRPAGPPALGSSTYATDFDEVKALGSATSTIRTADQLDKARFHTEAPNRLWTRNFSRLAETTSDLAEAARLLALIYVVHADATIACFEAKYAFDAWRPLSAIPLADTDDNAKTDSDSTWTPVLPTPPHPEYPAAHACVAGALAEALVRFYGTRRVAFAFDSAVTGGRHDYASVDAFIDEIVVARIAGGMHFRFSLVDGLVLGQRVGEASAMRLSVPRR